MITYARLSFVMLSIVEYPNDDVLNHHQTEKKIIKLTQRNELFSQLSGGYSPKGLKLFRKYLKF